MTSINYHDFWAEWFNSGGVGRGIGNPTRSYAENHHTFIDWVRKNEANGTESYCSVQPFSKYETPTCIEKVFFDFDSKANPEAAIDDAFDFGKRLRKFYNVEPLVLYSGNKGAHVYVFLEHPFGYGLEVESMSMICKKLMLMLRGTSSYESLDEQIKGSVVQLSRLPYSHHQVSGKLCAPINETREVLPLSLDHIDRLKQKGLKYELCKRALGKVVEDVKEKERREQRAKKSRSTRRYSGTIRPCIQAVLDSKNIHTPQHLMKLAAVAELNANGWGPDRIISAFRGMSGFKEWKTSYFVRHAIRKGYKPSWCTTIQSLGGCLGSDCVIYRRKN